MGADSDGIQANLNAEGLTGVIRSIRPQLAVVSGESELTRSFWRHMVWLPVPLLAGAIMAVWAANLRTVYESPDLEIALNFVFSVLVSLFIVVLISRSFLETGAPGLLMFGCGVISWGAAGFTGTIAGLLGDHASDFANIEVTIHSTSVWLSAACHLTGVVLLLRQRRALRAMRLWLAVAYAAVVLVIGLITRYVIAERLSIFIIQGQGGTPLRQLLLGSATGMFALTGILLGSANRRSHSVFTYLYSLALAFITVGLFGLMMEPADGSPLSWMGQAAQFLGGAYILAAVVASVKESHEWRIPLEEVLHRQPAFLSELLRTVGALVAVLDRKGRIVSFNSACEETTGYSNAEVMGKYVWDLFLVPDEVEPVKAVFAQLQAGRFPNTHENYWLGKDGVRRVIHWTNTCLTDYLGAVEYVVATGVDVTERRMAEEALLQAKDDLERKVEKRTAELKQINERLKEENQERIRTEQSLRLEEARLDTLFRLSQMDMASLEEITAFTLEQAIKLTHSKIGFLGFLNEDESIYTLHAVSKDVVKECRVNSNPMQWHVIDAGIWAEAIRKNKTLFVNDYGKPHPGKKGLPAGHPGVKRLMVVPIFESGKTVTLAGVGDKASDYEKSDERQIVLLLTGMWGYVQRSRSREALRDAYNELEEKVKRRTAELAASTAALRASQTDLNRAQEVGQIGSWRLDIRHNILSWSDQNHRMFGVPKGAPMTYETFLEIVHPDDRKTVDRRWKAALGGKPYDLEHRIVVNGQVKWVRERAYMEFDNKGKLRGGFGITQDITDLKHAEEALRELNATLENTVARRTEELEHRALQLRKLTLELTEAEERERKRVAGILHDDLQQVLVAATFYTELLNKRIKKDTGSCEAVNKVRDLLIEAIDKSRSLSHELHSPALSTGDMGGAFQWLAQQMQVKHSFTVSMEIEEAIEVNSEPCRFFLYSAARELLLNVIKHAGVREALLILQRQRGRIQLKVSDRGRGFDAADSGLSSGLGLMSIREHAEYLGGRLRIKSTPRKGSTLIITVPDTENPQQEQPQISV